MATEIITEDRTFNFYGGRRMSENEQFPTRNRIIRGADGAIEEWQELPEARAALYAAVEARAKALLKLWPDVTAIRIHEREGSASDDIWISQDPPGERS